MWHLNKSHTDIFLNFFISKSKKMSSIKRQLLLTYNLYVVGIFIALIANLTGFTGPQEIEPLIFNLCFLITTATVVFLYSTKKIKPHKAFSILTLATHLFTCNEMFICATTINSHGAMLILGNVVILVTNTMFAMFFYIKKLPSVLSALSTVTYIACTILTGDQHLKEFSVIMVIVFIIIAILGNLLVKNAHDLNSENWTLKKEDEALLEVLQMEKEQMQAYIELAKKRHEQIDSNKLLELLSDEARMNIIINVKEAITAKEIANKNLSEIYPELTPSEIEICGLIIHDKKINEISSILKKSESNITCQRTNIRKKLGLQPKDNLNEVLKTRFREYSGNKEKETIEKFSLKNFRIDKGK